MLTEFDDVLDAINKFKQEKMNFVDYKQRLNSRASLIGEKLDYEKNWENTLDAWLEFIEFFYSSDDWYELGCSLGDFLEDAIKNEPKPLKLPENDRVIREQFLKS